MKAIGKVRPVLAEMQTSGKSLAKKIGCTESPTSRWRSNKAQPSLEDLVRKAAVLEVDLRNLIIPTLNK